MSQNKKLLLIIPLIIIAVIGIYRTGKDKTGSFVKSPESQNDVNLINADEFSRLSKNSDAFLLDVHIPEQTHIPGTDAFIPFDDIESHKDQLPEDKDTPILVYCRSGNMSKIASQEISDLGYTNIYDLDGGVKAYKGINDMVSIYPDNKDLGTVIYGDIPTTTFIFTNYTANPVNITRVSTSCGCTSAEVEKRELGAYESTTVNVSFNPAVHEDDTDLGELTRTIYINTDHPNFGQVISMISANVIKQ